VGLFIVGLLSGWFARDIMPGWVSSFQAPSSSETDQATTASIPEKTTTLTGLMQQGSFEQTLIQLDESQLQLDAESIAELLIEVAQFIENALDQKLEASYLEVLIQFAGDYLETHIYDNRVRKALADLYLKNNKAEQAIRSLYKILEFPDSELQTTRVRSRIRVLVQGQRSALIAEEENLRLVVFYTWLLRLDTGNDMYRMMLATWKVRTGELQEAEDLLAEISDVTLFSQVTVLSESIALQRSDIPGYHLNGHLVTDAYIHNTTVQNTNSRTKLRLLIDTGASITTINVRVLELAGAENTGRTALIGTASGRVDAPVYRIESLLVGNVHLSNQIVLGMRIQLPGIDGLLGMDILGRTDLNLVYPKLRSAPAHDSENQVLQ